MTDLVTLIKTAIENVPQRDKNGRIDVQAMAEAAAKAVKDAGWVDEPTVAVREANAWSEGFLHMPDLRRSRS